MANTCKLPQPWASLCRQHGSGKQLAAFLAVSYETLYRWAHGLCEPSPADCRRLDGLFAKAGLPKPVYRNLPGYDRNRSARHAL